MNYSDPSNDRRSRLMTALLGHSPHSAGAAPLFGGAGRGSAGGLELPEAALPALSFNPYFAQQSLGIQGLAPPTQVTMPSAPSGSAQTSGPTASGMGAMTPEGGSASPMGGYDDPSLYLGGSNPADVALRRLMGGSAPLGQLTTVQPARGTWAS